MENGYNIDVVIPLLALLIAFDHFYRFFPLCHTAFRFSAFRAFEAIKAEKGRKYFDRVLMDLSMEGNRDWELDLPQLEDGYPIHDGAT